MQLVAISAEGLCEWLSPSGVCNYFAACRATAAAAPSGHHFSQVAQQLHHELHAVLPLTVHLLR